MIREQKIDVSIIIPVYNGEKYIKKSIESVCAQNIANLEIIIINDGSTDKTELILNELKTQFKKLVIIKTSNNGLSSARNTGLKIAKGEYIQFLDVDDVMVANSLSKSIKLMQTTKCDIAIFQFDYSSKEGNQIEIDAKQLENLRTVDLLSYLLTSNIDKTLSSWRFLCNKKYLIDNNLYFNEDYIMIEDVDWVCRIVFSNCRMTAGNFYTIVYNIDNIDSITQVYKYKKSVIGLNYFYDRIMEYKKLKTGNINYLPIIYEFQFRYIAYMTHYTKMVKWEKMKYIEAIKLTKICLKESQNRRVMITNIFLSVFGVKCTIFILNYLMCINRVFKKRKEKRK
ncbi:MAG: glycosyltransferase family 2 protein [Erysipelotrichales bacterium]|nr:glycosyltransferase family 2 protein [Erysipelotrichales bacterium]